MEHSYTGAQDMYKYVHSGILYNDQKTENK